MANTQAQQRALGKSLTAANADEPEYSAVSLLGPLKSEVRVFDVTTSSVLWHAPNGVAGEKGTPDWRGRLVRFAADGGDIGIVFMKAGDTTATATLTAKSASTLRTVNGVNALAPTAHASNEECFEIRDGSWLDLPVAYDCPGFAIIGSAACVMRTHPSEK